MSEKAFRENVLPAREGGAGQARSSLPFTGFVVATGVAFIFLF